MNRYFTRTAALSTLTGLAVIITVTCAPAASDLSSSLVRTEDAVPTRGPWGEWLRYFRSDTHGTKDMVVLAVTLKPGQEPHPPHKHAEEEILILAEGEGRWHLDGKESPAQKGDAVYAAPWIMHGVKNTGTTPLTYYMVKFSGKGVAMPTQPAADNVRTVAEKSDGWLLLFDGKTTAGWMNSDRTAPRTPVADGTLNPHKAGHYMLVHTQQWENFVLALDFKISKGCNSGIFVHTFSLTPLPGKDVGWNGMEVAIDDTPGAGFHDTGAIYDLVKPAKNAMKPVGEWNHIEITCDKSLIDVMLNGEHVTHMNMDEFTQPNRRPDGSEHKFDIAYKNHPRKGYIGLQDHGSPCWFKNIKLRPLN